MLAKCQLLNPELTFEGTDGTGIFGSATNKATAKALESGLSGSAATNTLKISMLENGDPYRLGLTDADDNRMAWASA
ncbi:hypothetical protein NPX13_g3107 [Xylaria arbuscula]|uniref:Uncharacterized protein n=1 Tax=Xylaria arbuscula TaxID=114810 RepID=A0A9W8NIY3_9PEZI|nr:hypothetical protein NPX13_g3107 [Xylaria arbuscula]